MLHFIRSLFRKKPTIPASNTSLERYADRVHMALLYSIGDLVATYRKRYGDEFPFDMSSWIRTPDALWSLYRDLYNVLDSVVNRRYSLSEKSEPLISAIDATSSHDLNHGLPVYKFRMTIAGYGTFFIELKMEPDGNKFLHYPRKTTLSAFSCVPLIGTITVTPPQHKKKETIFEIRGIGAPERAFASKRLAIAGKR